MSRSARPFPGSAIGAFIREQRKARGLTQGDLARKVGVGTRVVNELERGKPTVQMVIAQRVLAAFGMSLGVVEAPALDLPPRPVLID